jgi:hypothetical protein
MGTWIWTVLQSISAGKLLIYFPNVCGDLFCLDLSMSERPTRHQSVSNNDSLLHALDKAVNAAINPTLNVHCGESKMPLESRAMTQIDSVSQSIAYEVATALWEKW